VAGFLPGLSFFARGLGKAGRADADALFFVIWFALIFVFFSLSHSKLSPYLFPAFPPAAALAARGFTRAPGKGFRPAAIVSALLAPAAFAIPAAREAAQKTGALPAALLGSLALVAGAAACFVLRRREETALGCPAAGWAGFYLSLAFLWPHTALATDLQTLARDARSAAAGGGTIASYRTYIQTFPWALQSVVPLADHTSELEYWWLPPEKRAEIFWSKEDFWRRWRAGERLVVLRRKRDAEDFARAAPAPVVISSHGKHEVVANFKP